MKKTLILFLLILALLASIAPMSFAKDDTRTFDNFTKVNEYKNGQFSDVASSAWYAGGVKTAFEYNLVKGSSASKFNPTGNMTIAEAVALAARIHSIYNTGSAEFVQGNPWYQVYMDYALENNIIRDEFTNNNAAITRGVFVSILANALPKGEFDAINYIYKIPDVNETSPYYNVIYLLYNAGVLTGSDKYGTFNASSNIQRSEVATIAVRMVNKSERKTFRPEHAMPEEVVISGSTTIQAGAITILKAKIKPESAHQSVTWVSGNTGVATVDANGNVTGIREGQAHISAISAGNVKATVLVTVTSRPAPQSITLSGKSSISVGETTEWSSSVTPASADQRITWTSENSSIATVDANGNITGIKEGQVNITATATNGVKKMISISVVDYSYLAATDFAAIKRQYPSATPIGGYVQAYTNFKGEKMILVYMQYKDQGITSVSILHNLTSGRIIEEPADYYGKLADKYKGNQKKEYSNLQNEFLAAEEKIISAYDNVVNTGINNGSGSYVSADKME